jgi:hypothetical protein
VISFPTTPPAWWNLRRQRLCRPEYPITRSVQFDRPQTAQRRVYRRDVHHRHKRQSPRRREAEAKAHLLSARDIRVDGSVVPASDNVTRVTARRWSSKITDHPQDDTEFSEALTSDGNRGGHRKAHVGPAVNKAPRNRGKTGAKKGHTLFKAAVHRRRCQAHDSGTQRQDHQQQRR